MTNHKKTIQSLIERASGFQDRQKNSIAIDCLIQAVGLMAESLEDPGLEPDSSKESFNLEESIATESNKRHLTDIDIMLVWQLGLAAWDASKKWGARFPHE